LLLLYHLHDMSAVQPWLHVYLASCAEEVRAVLCDITPGVVEGRAAKELECMHAKRVTQHRKNNTALLCIAITARCAG
jgi:hypothetical protein